NMLRSDQIPRLGILALQHDRIGLCTWARACCTQIASERVAQTSSRFKSQNAGRDADVELDADGDVLRRPWGLLCHDGRPSLRGRFQYSTGSNDGEAAQC